MRSVDESVCRDLPRAVRREWLETNGIGGYASSTIVGLNTRRYHGLLVAALHPPVGRYVLLSKLEETLIVDGRCFELSCNRYPGVVHPQGHLLLHEFRQNPFPVFVYRAGGVEIEKSIFSVQGENTSVIQYTLRSPAKCMLEVRPLLAFRDYHSLTHENPALNREITMADGVVECALYPGLPPLALAHNAAEVRRACDWYRNFEYSVEQERGLDFREDLWNPGVLVFDFQHGAATVIASTHRRDAGAASELRNAEIARRRALSSDNLTQAADQFIVSRGAGKSVIAGYHWFTDWGRDTMIALPGLTLATGRFDDARSILLSFARAADRGMLPNRFPDAGEAAEYNTIDATLWMFEAVRAYLAHTGDEAFVREQLVESMAEIVAWHVRGTRYGIHVDHDGLLAGEEQLTWMDARVGGRAVTPRRGKAVEIQALWYNALRVMQDLTGLPRYRELADRAYSSFTPLFWNDGASCLYDVVDGDFRDPSIRPNQIFAASLFHKILPAEKRASVVAVVEKHLLTPYGLRTLAPSDPQYRGRFEGDPASRDGAYHQGTVWPWLLAPFLRAYLDVHGESAEAYAKAAEWTGELRRYVEEEGMGQAPEVFHGDAPHRSGGCIAQAWSIAGLLLSVE